MKALNNFRRNIRAACDKAGISQRQLAEDAGIHYVTVNRILRGHLCPTIDVCEKIADAAKVPVENAFSKAK